MKSFNLSKLLVFRVLLGFLLLNSLAFAKCTLKVNPTNQNVEVGKTATINYTTSGCSLGKYKVLWTLHTSPKKQGVTPSSSLTSKPKGKVDIKVLGNTDTNKKYKVTLALLKKKSDKVWTKATSEKTAYIKVIANGGATSKVTLKSYPVTVTEGEMAKVKVEIKGNIPSGKSISVTYKTRNGTAKSGKNYTSKSGTLAFNSSNKVQYINIQTQNDNESPLKDRVIFHIDFTTKGKKDTVDIGIRNKDTIGFANPTYTGLEGQNLKATVELHGVLATPFEVRYKTQDITAKSGIDYEGQTNGVLKFRAGEISKDILIPLKADSKADDNEKFQITLLQTSNSLPITKNTAQGIIRDIDTNKYMAEFTQSVYNGREGDEIIFKVQINKNPQTTLKTNYETQSDSAKYNQDYANTKGTLTFSPNGSLIQEIRVPILNDNEDEYSEKFFLEISSTNPSIEIPNKKAIGFIIGKQFDDTAILDGCNGNKCVFDNRKENFSLRFGGGGYSAYGDIALTGESIMCPTNKNGSCDWNLVKEKEYTPTKAINELGFKKNSSKAVLDIPNVVTQGKEIVFARLYWQGNKSNRDDKTPQQLKNSIHGWSSITFRTPDGKKYDLRAKKEDTNWFAFTKNSGGANFSGGKFFYQASVDVTDIVKKYIDSNHYKNTKDKTFGAGNIIASTQGSPQAMVYHNTHTWSGGVVWGHWGGWTLAVAYGVDRKKAVKGNIKYKNIAIYDGYKAFFPWTTPRHDEIQIKLDGFYTPPKGKIDSKFSFFMGSANGLEHPSDGYMNFYNSHNWHDIYNSKSPKGNPLNGTYTYKGKNIHKNRENHAGVNLDTYDISKVMQNGQTSATIKFGGYYKKGYAYSGFPSMVTFSTQIYEPKICYIEEILYDNKKVPSETIPSTIPAKLKVKLEIRNEGNEEATDIKIGTAFDTDFTYIMDSILLGNTQSDGSAGPLIKSRLTMYYKPNLYSYIGRGATNPLGGTLKAATSVNPYKGDLARITYGMTMHTRTWKEREYFGAFSSPSLPKTKSCYGKKYGYCGPIYKCSGKDESWEVPEEKSGEFNAVSKKVTGNTISTDENNPQNSLFTQITGKEFTLWILSLEDGDDSTTKKLKDYNGKVKVELVEASSVSQGAQNAIVIPDTTKEVDFGGKKQKKVAFESEKASKEVKVRITYKDSSGTTHYMVSKDTFAIRPLSYVVALDGTKPYIGGRSYPLNAKAVDEKNVTATGYTTSDVDITLENSPKVGCGTKETQNKKGVFGSGVMQPIPIKTANMGDYNYTMIDTTWTLTDQVKKSDNTFDCIKGSSQTTKDANGKIGCNIEYKTIFEFSPRALRASLELQNFKDGNFTYVADDRDSAYNVGNPLEMNATLKLKIEAVLDFNASLNLYNAPVAKAYDKNCYAKNVDIDLAFINQKPLDWDNSDARQEVIFQDENGNIRYGHTNNGKVTLKALKTDFNQGASEQDISFNFQRNRTISQNPFTIQKSDFNVTLLKDLNNVKGEGIKPSIATDKNASFYYARIHAPKYIGKSPLPTKVYFEVYCAECNTSRYNIFDKIKDQSVDDIYWFINKKHVDMTYGKSTYESSTGVSTKQAGSPEAISNGTQKLTWINPNAPTTDTVKMKSSPHLLYNKFDPNLDYNIYDLEFIEKGNWAGKGDLGEVTEGNISKRVNRGMQW